MDSSADVPIILSEGHANRTAQALVNFLVNTYKLKTVSKPETLYRVQVGAFTNKANADGLRAKLRAEGYEAEVVISGTK